MDERLKKFDQAMIYRHQREARSQGKLGEKVGDEILTKLEGFEPAIPRPKRFPGQPFDRLCRKNTAWYIVEIKTGTKDLGGGLSATQKQRMSAVLKSVENLSPVLLQIDLKTAHYRIRCGDDVLQLLSKPPGKPRPIKPIIDWVNSVIYPE
jgi:hypothetical protein